MTDGESRGRVGLALVSIAALALVLRSLGAGAVFAGGGALDLEIADSAYHARRALYSFVNFPAVLVHDPYLAFPDGARVPMPPLWDWALGGVARLFGASIFAFERVAALASPVCALLTLLPVFALGRAVGSTRLGLAAALLFAVLPASARASFVGDVDHHAAVGLLGATLLWLSVASLGRDPSRRAPLGAVAAMVFVRAALMLTWSGSLLYLVLCESTLLGIAVMEERRHGLRAQAAGCLASALLVSPWLWWAGPSGAGSFATTDLSWFHPALLGGIALVALSSPPSWRVIPGSGAVHRLLLTLAVSLGVAGTLLVFARPLGEAISPALAFFSKTDSWGTASFEQQSLFFSDAVLRGGSLVAHRLYGFLAYLVPLVPIAFLVRARDPRRRSAALCLASWSLVLGVLAIAQVRFKSDFAPVGSVGLALLLAMLGRAAAGRWPRLPDWAVASVAGLVLLWPAVELTYLVQAPTVVATLRGDAGRLPLDGSRSLSRFMRLVRATTPETAGYLDDRDRPEYGVLCRPGDGHALQYFARRASPANAFGPYLDAEKMRASQAFYSARSETEALAIAARLETRYVMTSARQSAHPRFYVDRLHGFDGMAPGRQTAERVRLVAEGPARGVPQRSSFPTAAPPPGTIPHKLFERVEGAVLEAHAAPGSAVTAEVTVQTPLGRSFSYRAVGRANAEGRARLRVPYATITREATRPNGPYRVLVDGAEAFVHVHDGEVLEGAVVAVPAAATAGEPW